MKLSDKVVSLEIAQKLYDMGVRIETEFYWDNNKGNSEWQIYPRTQKVFVSLKYPAPLACEILDVLPVSIINRWKERTENINISKFTEYQTQRKLYCVFYLYIDNSGRTHRFAGVKLSDVLANILIHLLENNIIKSEDVNR